VGNYILPIGGQGMNAGLHDAVGLAWRLALALREQANPVISDSYSPERQRTHAALDAQ
jgi:3-(3-hydroxy-phenyl)propionate hydroxylase